jgi:hypothetical protein
MNDIEIWADIEGFPNYQVSTYGNVRNKITNKLISIDKSTKYPSVRLYTPDHKKKHLNIHLLEAKAFLGEPNECVNHIDGNKKNNHISNLEWCTYAHNNQHAYDIGLKKARSLTSEEAKRIRKFVDISYHYRSVIDLTTGKRYESIKATSEDGFRPNKVQRVCAGGAITHHGHVFVYADKAVV